MKSFGTSICSRLALCFLAPFLLTLAAGLPTPIFANEQSVPEASPTSEIEKAEVPYPAGFDDPRVELEEFELQLIPLTKDELSSLAVRWQEIAREKTKAVVEATIAAANEGDGTSEADFDRILRLTEDRNEAFKRFSAVVGGLEKKNGDEMEVGTYRAYRSAIIADETQSSSWEDLSRKALTWVRSTDGGGKFAISMISLSASLFALFVVAKAVSTFSLRVFRRMRGMPKLMPAFLARVIYWLTMGIGFLVVLSSLGVDITALFAIVGGGSFVLAFAMQETLGNLAAGVMLMINNPFDEGDYITAGNTSGTVKSVSIVSTTVLTPDNQVIVIPNSMIWGDVILNSTASDKRRVDLVFGIDYGDDPDKAAEIILQVANADGRVLDDPEQPWVRVTNLGESSVDLTARLWCKSDDYWELKFAITKAVKLAFDANDVSIPYPHTVEIQKTHRPTFHAIRDVLEAG